MRPVFSDRPWFGGDYNPEQWPEEIWDEDVRLMREAGVTLATVGVFSWALLEPREGEYDFAWLDRVLDTLHGGGIRVDLATATASPPPWFSRWHPESLPVTAEGVRLSPGSRQEYCPSSPAYRAAAGRLVRAMAERYGEHPALQLWHIGNEYGCHVARCYCDESAVAFRRWLEAKYGTIDELNAAWGTTFWSQHYGGFDEILPPRATPAFGNPAQLLDFDRFSSDELLACFLAEKAVLREITPAVPVTTNFMGAFRNADYWRWAPHLDVIADDLYPDPADADGARGAALSRDLMRSLGGGRPWILMEQSTSAVNFRTANAPKRPGQMRALSYQAFARGAGALLFFQWRQSAVGAERFHSAMLPHGGTGTRVWREVAALGAELQELAPLVGAPTPAQAAIVLSWDSWWAIEQRGLVAHQSYLPLVSRWHGALTDAGLVVDIVRGDEDLTGYPLVIAPALYVATDEQLARLDEAARAGSTVLVTDQTALVDERLRVRLGGYLGSLQDTLGVWIEEYTPLAEAQQRPGAIPVAAESRVAPTVRVAGSLFAGGSTEAVEWQDAVRVRDAEVLATFDEGDYAGWPALTRKRVGDGAAWYLATRLGRGAEAQLLDALLAEAGLRRRTVVEEPATGFVEVVRRGDADIVINHGRAPVTLALDGVDALSGEDARGRVLPPNGVAVIPAEVHVVAPKTAEMTATT